MLAGFFEPNTKHSYWHLERLEIVLKNCLLILAKYINKLGEGIAQNKLVLLITFIVETDYFTKVLSTNIYIL